MALCIILLAVVLCVIWGNSLLPGQESGEVSGGIAQLLGKILPFLLTDTGELVLRKLGHFSEFAALGLVLCWLFGMLRCRLAAPILCGVLAAFMDEGIQFFIPGRCSSIVDVGIDTLGVLTGTLVLFCVWKARKR